MMVKEMSDTVSKESKGTSLNYFAIQNSLGLREKSRRIQHPKGNKSRVHIAFNMGPLACRYLPNQVPLAN